MNGRRAALEALCEWDIVRGPVEALLDPQLARLDEREQRLARGLANGMLRRLQELDHVLAGQCRQPLAKIAPRALWALRLGAMQLLFMDRIPPSAAVNESVTAFKAKGRPPRWLVGFVNGVLRELARRQSREGTTTLLAADAPILNHPDWLVRRWQGRFGADQAEAICRCNNLPAPLVLRGNPDRCGSGDLVEALRARGIGATPGRHAPDAVRLEEYSGAVTSLPGFQEGWFAVQDEAAQLVSLLMAGNGRRWLDACAGLGGKTGHLAALLPPGATLTAMEPDPRRCRLLAENLARLGIADRVEIIAAELQTLDPKTSPPFDAILIDAPCSGTGVIRRHPDIRWNRAPEDFLENQGRQIALLRHAAGLLATGGALVYATCSLEDEENEAVIAQLLASENDLSIRPATALLPPAAHQALLSPEGYLRTSPLHGLDGFFAARLEKASGRQGRES